MWQRLSRFLLSPVVGWGLVGLNLLVGNYVVAILLGALMVFTFDMDLDD